MNVPLEDGPRQDVLRPVAGRGATTSMSSATKDDQDDGAMIIVDDPLCRGYPPGDPRNKKAADAKNETRKIRNRIVAETRRVRAARVFDRPEFVTS